MKLKTAVGYALGDFGINLYFISVMTFLFLPVIWFVTDKIIEPRLGQWTPASARDAPAADEKTPLTAPEKRGLAWAGAMLAALLTFANAVALAQGVLDGHVFTYEMGGWEPPYGIALLVDGLAALMLLIVSGAGSLALLAARPSIDAQIEQHRQPLFYAAWLLALSGLNGIVVSADAFNIFVWFPYKQ